MRTAGRPLKISRSVHGLWHEPNVCDGYSTAVSLHSHTVHSRESLDFVPRVLRHVPLANAALQSLEEKHRRETGKPIPFERAYWRPPLDARAAYHLEAEQIRDRLGLRPMVSITDHDNLEACAELDALDIDVPYSLEWTVPYHGTVFHIGVHNLPPRRARTFERAMAAATSAPARDRMAELLEGMHTLPEVLLVLNHPFSCEELLERGEHVRLLQRFLNENGRWLHALELNGLQSTVNNTDTIRLAEERAMPVVSGGDRHCLEPNGNLNLTNALSFAEFVSEIRIERRSSVLFMPQYRDPISVRYIEFAWHAVRNYPDFTGRKRFLDRLFFERENGETVTCGALWPNTGCAAARTFISMVGFLASPGIRAMHSMAMGYTGDLEAGVW